MTAQGPEGRLPAWSAAPFVVLVLAIAVFPVLFPRAWERRGFQGLVVGGCALPVLVVLVLAGRTDELTEAWQSYLSFILTLGALYVTTGGILVAGDLEARPLTNVVLVSIGAALASFVGTTGASMLMIRPLLAANRRRSQRAHLVPLFIIAVANTGGLLTPLGDPPLLVGYIGGVPFFWTLRLLPAWLLYVGWSALALYLIDRRAFAREEPRVRVQARMASGRLSITGRRNVALMLAVVPAAMLPRGARELALGLITVTSWLATPRALHRQNGFSPGPIVDVAIIFLGLFACLGPIKAALVSLAPALPLRHSWQLFWGSGLMSSVLDNAPTYSMFSALARGLSHGTQLVAGVSKHKLAAISIGSVVMGATTYIGNGPNLMVKAIADRERFPTPGFFRYAAFALAVMLPAHLVTTLALVVFDG